MAPAGQLRLLGRSLGRAQVLVLKEKPPLVAGSWTGAEAGSRFGAGDGFGTGCRTRAEGAT